MKKVLLDIRMLPEHSNDEIIERIRSITDSLTIGKRSFTIETKNNIPSEVTDASAPLVRKALRVNKEVFGVDATAKGCGPAFEGHMLDKHGIPFISAFGLPGNGVHSPNEYAEIDAIGDSIKLLTKIALED